MSEKGIRKNLVGQKIGFLEVIKYLRTEKHFASKRILYNAVWLTRCKCGREVEKIGRYLKHTGAKHCGADVCKRTFLMGAE